MFKQWRVSSQNKNHRIFQNGNDFGFQQKQSCVLRKVSFKRLAQTRSSSIGKDRYDDDAQSLGQELGIRTGVNE